MSSIKPYHNATFNPNLGVSNNSKGIRFCATGSSRKTDQSLYESHLNGVRFDAVEVLQHVGKGSFVGHRQSHHIRDDHIEDYLISLPVVGVNKIKQMGVYLEIEPGDFAITTTSRPLSESIHAPFSNASFKGYQVAISGSLLRERLPYIEEYCRVSIQIGAGAGKIMTSLFSLAITEGALLSSEQGRKFGIMLIDSITNTLCDFSGVLPLAEDPNRTKLNDLKARAIYYINANLSNPELNPKLIAKHCNVSVRYLHSAFSDSSTTIANLIRERRLDNCRVALQSNRLKYLSIIEIARKWGFKDSAHFSRIYKAKFSKTPNEERCII